jgi:hypothetical protein
MRTFSQEEAFEAVRAFNAMSRQLEQFARYATGNPKLNIRAHASVTGTDGDTLYIRPPLGLGVNRVHHRSKCGKRDEKFKLICGACDKREVIDFALYHEIAHVAFGSHLAHGMKARAAFEGYLGRWHNPQACNHAIQITQSRNSTMSNLELGDMLNKYMLTLVNAFEDVRVNELTFQGREGLRDIFAAQYRLLMEDDDTDLHGHVTKAQIEHPTDSQFIIGAMLKAMGYDLNGMIVESVRASLNDPRLSIVLAGAKDSMSPDDSLELAVMVFEIGHELGYMQKVQPCRIPEPELPEDETPSLNMDPEDKDGDAEDDAPDAGEEHPSIEEEDGADQQSESSGEQDGTRSGITGVGTGESDSSSGRNEDEQDRSVAPSEASNETSDARRNERGSEDDEPSDDADSIEESDDSVDDDLDQLASSGEPLDEDGQPVLHDPSDEESHADSEDIQGDVPTGADGSASEVSSSNDDKSQDNGFDADAEGKFDPSAWDNVKPGNDDLDVETSTFDGASDQPNGMESPDLDPGTPEDMKAAVERFGAHGIMNDLADGKLENITGSPEGRELIGKLRDLLITAISQSGFFDKASHNVQGVNIIPWPVNRGQHKWIDPGMDAVNSFMPKEADIARSILILREAFDDNRRAKMNRNERSGRINSRVLGSRAPIGDDRLFGSRVIPARKSYYVCIAIDCSNSTNTYSRSEKIRRMAFMQAEILTRLNIPFSMFGHSANGNFDVPGAYDLWMYIQNVKLKDEKWGDLQRRKLAGMKGVAWNLDGHAFEYGRKELDKVQATNKIFLYYSDGDMPYHNFVEEKEILLNELEKFKRRGYVPLGVGINTDSPSKYGLNTVRVDEDSDIEKVARQLTEAITGKKSR